MTSAIEVGRSANSVVLQFDTPQGVQMVTVSVAGAELLAELVRRVVTEIKADAADAWHRGDGS